MRAERDAGAGEGRRWRGCLAVMVCPVVVDKRSKDAIQGCSARVFARNGRVSAVRRAVTNDGSKETILGFASSSCTSHAHLMHISCVISRLPRC